MKYQQHPDNDDEWPSAQVDGTGALNLFLSQTAQPVRRPTADLIADSEALQVVCDIYENASPFLQLSWKEGIRTQQEVVPSNDPKSDWALAAWVSITTAQFYVTRLLPRVASLPVDLILELRERHADSLNSYHSRVAELANSSFGVSTVDEAELLMRDVIRELDREYEQLTTDVKGSSLWAVLNERAPVIAGTSVAVAASALVAKPVVASIIVGANSVGQAVTTTLESFRRKRQLKTHPLFWSLQFDDS